MPQSPQPCLCASICVSAVHGQQVSRLPQLSQSCKWPSASRRQQTEQNTRRSWFVGAFNRCSTLRAAACSSPSHAECSTEEKPSNSLAHGKRPEPASMSLPSAPFQEISAAPTLQPLHPLANPLPRHQAPRWGPMDTARPELPAHGSGTSRDRMLLTCPAIIATRPLQSKKLEATWKSGTPRRLPFTGL